VHGRHAGLALAARLTLERLTNDDSRTVAAAATASLGVQTQPGQALVDLTPLPAPRTAVKGVRLASDSESGYADNIWYAGIVAALVLRPPGGSGSVVSRRVNSEWQRRRRA
jgi:hypothetical protein